MHNDICSLYACRPRLTLWLPPCMHACLHASKHIITILYCMLPLLCHNECCMVVTGRSRGSGTKGVPRHWWTGCKSQHVTYVHTYVHTQLYTTWGIIGKCRHYSNCSNLYSALAMSPSGHNYTPKFSVSVMHGCTRFVMLQSCIEILFIVIMYIHMCFSCREKQEKRWFTLGS